MSDNIFDQHRLKIARRTLRLTDVGAQVLGGMTKAEARKVIKDRCISQSEFRRQLMQLEGTLEFMDDVSE